MNETKTFEIKCDWSEGSRIVSFKELFHHNPEHYDTVYGKRIDILAQNLNVGETVEWEEPFNGLVTAKRIS